LETISSIDPGKIYIENIRNFLKVSSHKALTFCEMAVTQNVFERRIGIVCPNDGRVIEEYENENQIPETITCHICELEDREPNTFKTSKVKTIVFYKLKT
jgi:hypothetical protein